MTSEKQIEANRRNALLSSGPKSPEGRNASGMNALRHGLTRQIDVSTPEEQEAKDKFCGEIVTSLAPKPGIELQFAHSAAEDHWRVVTSGETVGPDPRNVLAARSICGRRARSIENNIFTLACSFQDATGETEAPEIDKALGAARASDTGRAIGLMNRAEPRLRNQFNSAFDRLRRLQPEGGFSRNLVYRDRTQFPLPLGASQTAHSTAFARIGVPGNNWLRLGSLPPEIGLELAFRSVTS